MAPPGRGDGMAGAGVFGVFLIPLLNLFISSQFPVDILSLLRPLVSLVFTAYSMSAVMLLGAPIRQR